MVDDSEPPSSYEKKDGAVGILEKTTEEAKEEIRAEFKEILEELDFFETYEQEKLTRDLRETIDYYPTQNQDYTWLPEPKQDESGKIISINPLAKMCPLMHTKCAEKRYIDGNCFMKKALGCETYQQHIILEQLTATGHI